MLARFGHAREYFKSLNSTPAPPARQVDSPYLTVAEAAAYCRVAVRTIYNHRREIARLPGVGKLLFKKSELDRWLATRRKRR